MSRHNLREIRVVKENDMIKQDNNIDLNKKKKIQKKKKKDNDPPSSRIGGGAFKFNANAAEYVPKSMPAAAAVPVSGYIVPCLQYGGGSGGADKWIFVSDRDVIPLVSNANVSIPTSQCTKNNVLLTEQLQNKIIKQVEYQFSDMSLLANDSLVKQIRKDPEGFVPLAVVSSTKKLKSIISSNHNLIAEALRASSKLDVSNDGKRVRRKNPFTEKEKEELQMRTVVVENLPDDHSHQNLEKIFNVAGVVKTIRVCHPQEASSRGKGDCVISTMLHALVEFENMESPEKAVEKLDDERTKGKGLRVRLLLRRSPRSVLKNRKPAFDGYLDEEEGHHVEGGVKDNSHLRQQNNTKPFAVDNNAEDPATSSKKAMWSRGRGKPQQQQHSSTYNGRGLVSQSSLPASSESSAKQTIKGPRMPDGTKGFNMGRGRPISIPV